jgi:protein PhnA
MDVEDSNGAILKDGDAVQVIKDLKVKGTSVTLKRGTAIKNIHLPTIRRSSSAMPRRSKGWC